jgi:flagellar L-ring protein precursor FlgH
MFLVLGVGLLLAARANAIESKSLYHEGTYQPLTADHKARRVGDLVTILVYENASASSTADTSAARDANAGVSVEIPRPQRSHTAGVTTNNDFRGQGQTQRTGRVLAQLTVSIKEVLPNGDLAIAGTQALEINGEKQLIKLEGRVRAHDITDLNTVVSSRVADARISVVGDGTVSDQQKPGWWQRLLTLFGL